ncbi:hypothetical protein RFI_12974 [Reticulomyxa filosa]|uniref:Kinesin motor domain-containing protein n=1 Tax=Reticulomyxa filosa TaxID=46433 RepID=X6NE67_RETFI|nr:hypothetical protein RFI_12974 [Reticulomyxa filosa]|eukprot:ETO24183.1 hypothetical protein RFI_12974 [Reticulomyxa filosa]
MEGGNDIEQAGVIYRSVNELFRLKKEKIDQHELLHSSRSKGNNGEEDNSNYQEKVDIRVWLSCLEVYNETIRDLMIDRNAEIQTQLKVKLGFVFFFKKKKKKKRIKTHFTK